MKQLKHKWYYDQPKPKPYFSLYSARYCKALKEGKTIEEAQQYAIYNGTYHPRRKRNTVEHYAKLIEEIDNQVSELMEKIETSETSEIKKLKDKILVLKYKRHSYCRCRSVYKKHLTE